MYIFQGHALPGLMSQKQPTNRLLRKPRAPAPGPVRPPDSSPPPKSYHSQQSVMSQAFSMPDIERLSPPPSVHPSVVSPPPPSELHSTIYVDYSQHSHKTSSIIRKGDLKYVLDPITRSKTQLGTYVEGHTLIRPYKPRGPDGLPQRLRKRQPEISHSALYEDEVDRFYQPPEFTFHDFMIRLSEIHRVPLKRVKQAMYSRHNYLKIQDILIKQITPKHKHVTMKQVKPSGEYFPDLEQGRGTH